jgi:hypothetical protein
LWRRIETTWLTAESRRPEEGGGLRVKALAGAG